MSTGLGRRLAVDVRDASYPMRALIPAEPIRTWRYWWTGGAWLDQGQTGTCVGHAWAHYVEDGPVTWEGTIDPYGIYREAVILDPWPDNDNGDLYFGTSVRAGAKAIMNRGRITEYRWAWDAPTVVDAVLSTGPVVIGSNWYDSMFYPDEDGLVSIEGSVVGGHAYLINGVNVDRGVVRFKNSWGRGWGRLGHGWMTIDSLRRLITENGEACLAVEAAS